MHNNDPADRAGDLQKVLEISRSLVAAADVQALLRLIADRSIELLEAERASVFLYESESDELVSYVAHGEKEIRIPADRGIAGSVVKEAATINVPDAYADLRFNPEVDRKTGFRTRNILAVPLLDYECGMVGVMQVLNKHSRPFDDYDIMLAEALAAQAGVAIQRHRLIQHFLQKQQMERAMKIAQEIQRGLLPQNNPSISGFDVAGFCEPADQTGGDTYDFMQLPSGLWMITVADATGHGIGPALVIAETRAMLRATSLHGKNVAAVLSTVNDLLSEDLADSSFVTCFLGLLDVQESALTYASAGHGPMLFYSRRDDRFTTQSATALPLGVLPDAPFNEPVHYKLDMGNFITITTDGFFEATNSAGEQFGIERMMALLTRDRDLPAQQMIHNLHEAVHEFTGQKTHDDDLTAVIVKRV